MKNILVLFERISDIFCRLTTKYIKAPIYKSCLGGCGKNVEIRWEKSPGSLDRIFLGDNVNILHSFRFISVTGKFMVKNRSGAAAGLTVITGNHQRQVGKWLGELSGEHNNDIEKDVIVQEDVWIGSNVTLLPGVTIGRGATIGAGSVCLKSIPPYAIVMGNPAKIVGFNYKPDEIIEHESKLYPEEDRLPYDLLCNNYNKYFYNRLVEINNHLNI